MNKPYDSEGLRKQTAQAGFDAYEPLTTTDRYSRSAINEAAPGAGEATTTALCLMISRITSFMRRTITAGITSSITHSAGRRRTVPWSWSDLLRDGSSAPRQGHHYGIRAPGDNLRWLELAQRLLAYWRRRIPWAIGLAASGGRPCSLPSLEGVDAPTMSVPTEDYGCCAGEPRRRRLSFWHALVRLDLD
jgi:hypothetical protein